MHFTAKCINLCWYWPCFSKNKLKTLGLIPLYSFVCLNCKTLLNLHCFASFISFQCMATSLHCKLLISNFQLVVPPALHMQWTTQVEKWQFTLISLLSSAHFVKTMNNSHDSHNLIGWLNKIDKGLVKIKDACAGQNL